VNAATAAQLGADLILLLTLLALIWQVRQGARATGADVYQAIADQMLAVDRLFFDHIDLRDFFFANQPLPSAGPTRERIFAAAELFVDLMDEVIAQERHLPRAMAHSWANYFVSVARTSPAIQQFWRAKRDWYDSHMASLLDPVCLAVSPPSGRPPRSSLWPPRGPRIVSVTPARGSRAGGDPVIVTGGGFGQGATLSFGGTQAVAVSSGKVIAAVSPPGVAGASVPLVVELPDGTRVASPPGSSFTYT
jgi:hypothetical protein